MVVLEVFLPGNFLRGGLRVVITIELGLAGLELGVGLITAREIKLEDVQIIKFFVSFLPIRLVASIADNV